MKSVTGYIATLDVLGFAEMLYRDDYSDILNEYVTCVNDVVRKDISAECVVFSDSIVLTSPHVGDDDAAFENIVVGCAAASSALLKEGIPVRGALAYGSYWREARDGSVFLAGRPIVEAYNLERASKWVGTLLCSSVLHRPRKLQYITGIPDEEEAFAIIEQEEDESLFHDLALRLQPASIPYNDGSGTSQLSGYGVVPLDANVQTLPLAAARIKAHCRRLEDLQIKASHPASQQKYSASLDWLRKVAKCFSEGSQSIKSARKKASS